MNDQKIASLMPIEACKRLKSAQSIVVVGQLPGSSAIIRIIHPSHTLVLLLKVLCCISHT